jgi:hypothetical protein
MSQPTQHIDGAEQYPTVEGRHRIYNFHEVNHDPKDSGGIPVAQSFVLSITGDGSEKRTFRVRDGEIVEETFAETHPDSIQREEHGKRACVSTIPDEVRETVLEIAEGQYE